MTGQLVDDDLLWFVDRALDGMLETCRGLGEDLANARLEVEGSNSPYAVVVHCLAALEEQVASARQRFAEAVASADWGAPCVGQDRPETHALPVGRTQGGALVHVVEELCQHRGQLEVTADVLRAGSARTGVAAGAVAGPVGDGS